MALLASSLPPGSTIEVTPRLLLLYLRVASRRRGYLRPADFLTLASGYHPKFPSVPQLTLSVQSCLHQVQNLRAHLGFHGQLDEGSYLLDHA